MSPVSSVSRWELINDFLSPLKWKLTWLVGWSMYGIYLKGQCHKDFLCYACPNQAKTLCSALRAILLLFTRSRHSALLSVLRRKPYQTTTRLRCLCAWTYIVEQGLQKSTFLNAHAWRTESPLFFHAMSRIRLLRRRTMARANPNYLWSVSHVSITLSSNLLYSITHSYLNYRCLPFITIIKFLPPDPGQWL